MKKLKWVAMGLAVALFVTACGRQTVGSDSVNLYEQIMAAGTIRIGTEGTYPPFTFHDETNTLVGYDVEVARAVAQEMGIQVQFVEARWDSLIMGLDNNQWDIVMNQVRITDARLENYDFSTPYNYGYAALIVRTDNGEISAFADLDGRNVAQSITSEYAVMAESYGGTVVGVDGFAQAIDLVLNGRADATINANLVYYDYKNQHPNANIEIVDEADTPTRHAIIMPKGQTELQDALNEVLQTLRDNGILTEISYKYFGEDISVEH